MDGYVYSYSLRKVVTMSCVNHIVLPRATHVCGWIDCSSPSLLFVPLPHASLTLYREKLFF